MQEVLKRLEVEIKEELQDKKQEELYEFMNDNLNKKDYDEEGFINLSPARYKTLVNKFEEKVIEKMNKDYQSMLKDQFHGY